MSISARIKTWQGEKCYIEERAERNRIVVLVQLTHSTHPGTILIYPPIAPLSVMADSIEPIWLDASGRWKEYEL
jgi:hypothetical protein